MRRKIWGQEKGSDYFSALIIRGRGAARIGACTMAVRPRHPSALPTPPTDLRKGHRIPAECPFPVLSLCEEKSSLSPFRHFRNKSECVPDLSKMIESPSRL